MRLPRPSRSPLRLALLLGALLQLAVVAATYYAPAADEYLAPLIMFMAFGAGAAYAGWAMPLSAVAALGGGALVGTTSAALGLLVAHGLGVVAAAAIAGHVATAAVTGMLGGALGRRMARRPRAAA